MKTVRQLDQNDPDILGHGQKHLPEVLRLHLQLISRVGQLPQLCDAIDQKCDLLSKLFAKLVECHDRVFHNVMQKSGCDRLLIQFQIGKDDRHTERMNDIRLP